jgi:AbrB family looped-hinge helix DNA binding protein
MSLVRVGPKYQVVIPKAVREQLDVQPGDYVDVALGGRRGVIVAGRVAERFTDEPIGPKTRAGIRRGLQDMKEGKVRRFSSAKDLIADLRSRTRKPKA